MNKQESTYYTLSKGCLLKGKSYDYYIEGVLGQGSFGITYLASARMSGELGSLNTGTRVAIKEFFMRDINGRDGTSVTSGSKHGIYEDYKRKFKREALNLSMLKHPDIVKVVEMFEANSTAYYVMEYIDGGSLNNYIDEHGPLNENTAVAICTNIGSALAFMHSKRMLHLDLKPSNIMMRRDGTPVLIDFGLSKQYDNNGEPESSTNVGSGTPGYAPIEQADYHDGKGFPVTMDVYALGATMFKMLTGQRPPEASSILNDGFPYGLLKKHGVSTSVIKAVESAMNPVRSKRCASVKDFLYMLCSCANYISTTSDDTYECEKGRENVHAADVRRKKSVLATFLVLVSLIVVVVAGVYYFTSGKDDGEKPQKLDIEAVAPAPKPQKQSTPVKENKPTSEATKTTPTTSEQKTRQRSESKRKTLTKSSDVVDSGKQRVVNYLKSKVDNKKTK